MGIIIVVPGIIKFQNMMRYSLSVGSIGKN